MSGRNEHPKNDNSVSQARIAPANPRLGQETRPEDATKVCTCRPPGLPLGFSAGPFSALPPPSKIVSLTSSVSPLSSSPRSLFAYLLTTSSSDRGGSSDAPCVLGGGVPDGTSSASGTSSVLGAGTSSVESPRKPIVSLMLESQYKERLSRLRDQG